MALASSAWLFTGREVSSGAIAMPRPPTAWQTPQLARTGSKNDARPRLACGGPLKPGRAAGPAPGGMGLAGWAVSAAEARLATYSTTAWISSRSEEHTSELQSRPHL